MNSRLVFAFPIALMLSVALALSLLCNLSQGQVSSTIPRAAYFGTFTEFYIGDYQDAGRDFSRGANTAFRFGNERFLDSTCYWTMVGECHFHQGNYRDALANYDQALNLYLAFNRNSWQNRINPPRTLSVRSGAFTQSRVNWGTPRRTVKIPSIPSTFGVQFGRTDAGRAFQEGGTFDQAELRQVAVSEIMRCTTGRQPFIEPKRWRWLDHGFLQRCPSRNRDGFHQQAGRSGRDAEQVLADQRRV